MAIVPPLFFLAPSEGVGGGNCFRGNAPSPLRPFGAGGGREDGAEGGPPPLPFRNQIQNNLGFLGGRVGKRSGEG